MEYIQQSTAPSPSPSQQENLRRFGEKMIEDAIEKRSHSETADRFLSTIEEKMLQDDKTLNKETFKAVKEDFDNTVKEDLQFGNNSALYTTAIADFIEQEFEPDLVAVDAINTLTLGQGRDSIKIPKQPDLQVASTIANDGTLTDDSADYTETTIQTDFIGLRSTMTVELLRNANIDLMEDQLRQISDALERKVDADIITEIKKASTKNDATYGSNNNFEYLGTGNTITYEAVVDAFYGMIENNADPDMLLMSPEVAGNLFNDTDVKDAVAFGTVSGGDQADIAPQMQSFLGMPVIISSQVGADRAYWLDTDRLGYLVEKTGIETMDQQLDNKAAFEVKAFRGFGVEVTKPQAVYSIIEDAAEP